MKPNKRDAFILIIIIIACFIFIQDNNCVIEGVDAVAWLDLDCKEYYIDIYYYCDSEHWQMAKEIQRYINKTKRGIK